MSDLDEAFINEQDLLLSLSKGDEEAFSQIYNRHWKALYNMALKRLNDEEQAKDVVQDIFEKLWSQRESLSIGKLRPYLMTSVRYSIYNLIARNKVNDTYFKYLSLLDDLPETADDVLIFAELQDRISHIISNMPSKRKVVFDLRYESGLSTDEIARRLNITQKTVQNQLLKAVSSIRDFLVKSGTLFWFLF